MGGPAAPARALRSEHDGGPGAGDLAPALLALLRARFDARALDWAEPPRALSGGSEALVLAFRLRGGGPPGPLVLRMMRPKQPAEALLAQAEVQRAVAAQGVPAPRVHLVEPDARRLGGPFLVMEQLPGEPLLGAAGALARARTAAPLRVLLAAARDLRGLLRLPLLLADVEARVHALDPRPLLERAAPEVARRWTISDRLRRIAHRIESRGARGLEPGLSWLVAHRPLPSEAPVIVHGDLAPGNLLVRGPRVSGVIDWSKALIADRECGVGFTRIGLRALPFLRGRWSPLRRLPERAAEIYTRRYRAHHVLDEERVAYFEVMRAISMLASIAKRRRRTTSLDHVLDAPAAEHVLTARIRRLSGLSLSL